MIWTMIKLQVSEKYGTIQNGYQGNAVLKQAALQFLAALNPCKAPEPA